MSEQLSLFTIHPIQVCKPKSDPYWDEIECDNVDPLTQTNKQICDDLDGLLSPSQLPESAPEQNTQKSVAVGDWVKVSLEWLDKCRQTVDKQFYKYYQHKSKHDLVCKVIGLSDEGSVYIPRGPQRFLFVPKKYFEIAPEHTQQRLGSSYTQQAAYPCNNVRAQVANDTKQFAPEHTHYTEEYWVKRGFKKHYYYRYCWMLGRKKHPIHIGSTRSAIAKNRKLEIESAIADGESPAGIQNLIRSWKL